MTMITVTRPPTAGKNGIDLHKPFNRHHRPPDTPTHVTPVILLRDANILSYLLLFFDWEDLYSLLNSSNACRSLFNDPDIRDVIFSRFVPWYRHAITLRDPSHGYKDVPLSIRDLDLLLMSQHIPLHQYPIHAHRVLTSSYSPQETATISSWLRSLTEAHSRFVLLLQAYVHSSNNTAQTEPEDVPWVSRIAAPSNQLRKLTFPAPLSYHKEPSLVPRNHSRSKNSTEQINARLLSKRRRFLPSFDRSTLPHRHSLSQQILSESATEPRSKHWARSSIISQLSRETGYASDDSMFPYPTRDVSIDSLPYSRSASGSSYLSTSRNSLTPFATTRRSSGSDSRSLLAASPSFSSHIHSIARPSSIFASYPIRLTSPLDLSFAVSRIRAPILRTFVPCTELEDDSAGLLLCEQQLIDAGLWDHLSTGDIVCNLGYVPTSEDDNMESPMIPSPDGDPSPNQHRRGVRPKWRNNSGYGRPAPSRKWLLFNGQFLVPHKPGDTICLPDPLTLPTPFYYTHIMPPYTNPTFVIDGLGIESPKTDQLESRLIRTMINVPSPQSSAGRALVRKYAWVVRVPRSPLFWDSTGDQEPQYIGGGWMGEWALEGEGTKEGKELLMSCVLGKIAGPISWEVVVERCGGGRVWLRLLGISPLTSKASIKDMIQDL